jgi:hypothetical protein
LIRTGAVPAYRVRDNRLPSDPRGGNSKFTGSIKAHFGAEGGLKRFDRILIVSDNDVDPEVSFQKVRDQVEAALGFAPNKPRQVAKGPPRVMILMIPWDNEPGNLETMCAGAARDVDKRVSQLVDNFQVYAGVDKWNEEVRQQEMWFRTNLAVRCEANPLINLLDLFGLDKNHKFIPPTAKSFPRVCEALASFGS